MLCTISATDAFTSETMLLISFTESDVSLASFPISLATTENPLPASPALAASIDAFKARRLVWDEICMIDSVMALIRFTLSAASMAFAVWSLIFPYISVVLLAATSVDSFRESARSVISLDKVTPLFDNPRISSAPFCMPSILSLIAVVVAEVSSMPAASSSVVAELSIHFSRIVLLTSFTFPTSS